MSKHLLELNELKTHFQTERGRVTAIDGISLYVDTGEVLAVVGESGCGKSVTAQSILRLFEEGGITTYEGEIAFEGENLLDMSMSKMRRIRGNDISMIFQDPLSSLNPVYTIGNQIVESLVLHQKLSKEKAYEKAIEMLKLTGIPAPEKRVHEYPHELSGGMRQRVMIAMALACQPKLLIADEPTTALDVTIQAQILDLMIELKEEFNMGVMFITHDLGVVAQYCTRVVVMYLGEVVEEAEVTQLFSSPQHPYTKGLMKSIPQLEGDRTKKLHIVEGTVPSLEDVPVGCRFAARCSYADDKCLAERPILESCATNQKVRCWHYRKITEKEGRFNGATNA
ncbi:ABC transporter ATP-binding protein [Halalkalibacter nanhaiisediminis]|uniref:Peptide/nickel transport system ATP-binding protein n=1 Tax=Halalkalibacter nanhaiisediminis TaxID=688079 RepID=A0A562QN64_9BACI|nr:ABC transporter ATP-binding protein [Halalkalibacter nanhaiisediminis]TWI58198.1 peptide/nickel transport system ATP-binding protein [Halalkalibacter nanhaiisediminis]